MSAARWRGKVDFGIITIREDEHAAVLARFPENLGPISGYRVYRLRRLTLSPTESYTIAVVRCLEQGNGDAHDAARDLLEELAPTWLFVVGIAGGVPAHEFSLGDVIVSTRIADFSVEAVLRDQSQEYALAGGPLHRNAGKLAADIRAMVHDGELDGWNDATAIGKPRPPVVIADDRFYGDDEWKRNVRATLERHFGGKPTRAPIVTTGAIASSDRLIKDAETLGVWMKIARQIQAVEMESAGVYRAAQGREIPFLAIRGISDVVGFRRDQDWTEYACHSAAAFLVAFLRTRAIPPRRRDDEPSPATKNRQTGGSEVQVLPSDSRELERKAASTEYKMVLDNAEARYRALVILRCTKLPVLMPSAEPVELLLEDVYVDLSVIAEIPRVADTFSLDERRIFAELEGADEATQQELWRQYESFHYERLRTYARSNNSVGAPRSILKEVSDPERNTFVLLGDPGSGKSTLLQLLALRAARDGRTEPGMSSTRLLPILVRLAAYDAYCKNAEGAPSLLDFLALYWSRWEQFPNPGPIFERAIEEGRALVLLDGLDEVLTSAGRGFVVRQTEGLIRNAPPGNRFVITSRFVGYRQAGLSRDFAHFSLLDFGQTEIDLFLRRWYEALETRVAGGTTEAPGTRATSDREAMLEELEKKPHLLALAKNPLQLSMLALLRRQSPLPSQRVEVFDKFTRMLLDLRPHQRSPGARSTPVLKHKASELRRYLRDLALWMHHNRPSRTASRGEVLAVLTKTCLGADASRPDVPSTREMARAEDEAELVLEELQHISGVVVERGHDAFGFSHLTYQEFFAAGALAHLSPERRRETLRPILHHARWREPLLLCGGWLGVLEGREDDETLFLLDVLRAGSDHELLLHRDVLLAADIAVEDVNLSNRVLDQIAAALEVPLQSELSALRQAALLRIGNLARNGHVPSAQRILELLDKEINEDDHAANEIMNAINSLLARSPCQPIIDGIKQRIDAFMEPSSALASLPARNILGTLAMCYRRQLSKDSVLLRNIISSLGDGYELNDFYFVFGLLVKDNPVVQDLYLGLVDDPSRRQSALNTLATTIPGDLRVAKLLELYWDDPDANVRQAVYAGAMMLAKDSSVWKERLVALLEGGDLAARHCILNSIGSLVKSDPLLRDCVFGLLGDGDSSVVHAAMQALGHLKQYDPAVRCALLSFLSHREPSLRLRAVQSLGPLARTHIEIKTALIPMFFDVAPPVREAVLSSLAPLALEDGGLRERFFRRLSVLDGCEMSARIDTVAPLAVVDEHTRVIIAGYLRSSEVSSCIASIKALGPLAADDADIAVLLGECFDDEEQQVQAAIIDALRIRLPYDVAVRKRMLHVVVNGSANLRAQALDALAPCVSDPEVRQVIIEQIDARTHFGSAAAAAVATLASENPDVLSKLQTLTSQIGALREPEVLCAFSIIDQVIARDSGIFSLACSYLSDPRLVDSALKALCRHPQMPGVRGLLVGLLDRPNSYIRSRAIRALGPLMADDAAFRRQFLDAISCRHGLVALGELSFVTGLIDDDGIRTRLLEMTRAKRASDLGDGLCALKLLREHAVRFPAVEMRLREIFEIGHAHNSTEGLYVREAALGLASLMGRDPSLRTQLLPWLGVRTPAADALGTIFRRRMADAFAARARDDVGLRLQLVEMLDSPAWQSRQGAAWALMAAGAHRSGEILDRLRALLADDRAEESWTERLQSAAALLNHPTPALSRQAVEVATGALRYGEEPWYEPLGSETRARAAKLLGEIQPIYRSSELTQRVAKALEEERADTVRTSLYQALLQLAAAPDLPMA